jgi:hypothetical protein
MKHAALQQLETTSSDAIESSHFALAGQLRLSRVEYGEIQNRRP